jgi:hypothetical protein
VDKRLSRQQILSGCCVGKKYSAHIDKNRVLFTKKRKRVFSTVMGWLGEDNPSDAAIKLCNFSSPKE